MTRLLAATALVLGTLLVPATPAEAAAPVVLVDGMAFTPARVKIRIGQKVIWQFEDSVQHTTTSNQGFWNSGVMSAGDEYSHRFGSAGTYRYHCNIHSEMRGRVLVRMTASGSPAEGWTVQWSQAAAPIGRDFDVQFKRKGADSWSRLKHDTTAPEGRFNPSRDGTYLLRARTSNTNAGESSDWSPVKALTIS